MTRTAVVTGGSTGIGEAAARALAKDGWYVIVAARREELLAGIAADIGGGYRVLDVTDGTSVAKFAESIDRVDLLVNNAGGALGLDSVETGLIEDWQRMYDMNVLGTLRVTQALLPKIREANGQIIVMGSVAGRVPYKGGAGYNAAKHGLQAMTRVLRLETIDEPIRVCEIDPGRVKTDFSVNRFKGDTDKADAVYAGVENLTAADIGEAVRWVASLPAHVCIESMLIMPTTQIV